MQPLVEVVRHNDSDVRSLARLVARSSSGYGDRRRGGRAGRRPRRPRPGLRAGRRLGEALDCLDDALAARPARRDPFALAGAVAATSPLRVPCSGESVVVAARPGRTSAGAGRRRDAPSAGPRLRAWTNERMAVERAACCGVWDGTPRRRRRGARRRDRGSLGAIAWIEVAKLREHRLGDVPGALEATGAGLALVERRQRIGLPEPRLEADLRNRARRLRRRARRAGRDRQGRGGTSGTRGSGAIAASAPGRGRARDRTSRPSSGDRRPAH